jgi:hypothetical protein
VIYLALVAVAGGEDVGAAAVEDARFPIAVVLGPVRERVQPVAVPLPILELSCSAISKS